MTETDRAVLIANRVLDVPGDDPDADLAVLARQFLRAMEEVERLRMANPSRNPQGRTRT